MKVIKASLNALEGHEAEGFLHLKTQQSLCDFTDGAQDNLTWKYDPKELR